MECKEKVEWFNKKYNQYQLETCCSPVKYVVEYQDYDGQPHRHYVCGRHKNSLQAWLKRITLDHEIKPYVE